MTDLDAPENPAGISVVVPTRDRHAVLRRALRSVLLQDHPTIELIVVDDGSTVPVDERAVPELADFDGPVVVIRNEQPRGVAATRNLGIDAASTEWVAFLDDDDLWAPAKLSAQLSAVLAEPAAGWVCTGEAVVDPDLRVMRISPPPAVESLYPHLLASNVVPGGSSSVMARTDLVRAVGSFDRNLSALADWDLWTRLAERSDLAVVPGSLVAYVVAPGGLAHDITHSRQEMRYLRYKYRAQRLARGVSLDERAFEWYFGEHELRSGRRGAAARTHLRLAWRYRSWSALKVVVAGTVWRDLQAYRDHHHHVPPGAREEADKWLDDYRAVGGAVTSHRKPSCVTRSGRFWVSPSRRKVTGPSSQTKV